MSTIHRTTNCAEELHISASYQAYWQRKCLIILSTLANSSYRRAMDGWSYDSVVAFAQSTNSEMRGEQSF